MGQQDNLAIRLRLVLKDVPGGHGNHSRMDTFGKQIFMSIYSKTNFTATGDEDDLRVRAGRVGEYIRPARDTRGGRIPASIQCPQGLARQYRHRRLMLQLHDIAVSLNDLVGVARPQRDQSRNGAQRQQVFHGLVRRAIFAVAHRVVCEDKNGGQFHESREPDGGPSVVTENEKSCPETSQLGNGKSVHRGRHGVFADAEMQIPSTPAISLKISCSFKGEPSFVRRTEIRRPSEEPWDIPGENIQHLARSFATGDTLRVGREDGKVAIPAGGKFASLHLVNLGREFRKLYAVAGEELRPVFPGLRAALANSGLEVGINAFGDEKLCVFGPSVSVFGKANLLVAKRLTVSFGRVLPMR